MTAVLKAAEVDFLEGKHCEEFEQNPTFYYCKKK